MSEDEIFRRKGVFSLTAAKAIETEILPGTRNSYFEWCIGTKYDGRWYSTMNEASCDIGRGHLVGFEAAGGAFELRCSQLRFYLHPVVARRVRLGSNEVPAIVAAAVDDYMRLNDGEPPWPRLSAADSDESVWLEVFVLETGKAYHAKVREIRHELPPGRFGRRNFGSHRVLDISDRLFEELGENPEGTPRTESISY